jgi:chemotaxis protein histidine kinase CheA
MREQVPAEIIAEFRSLSLERLANIEASWHEVISEPDGELGINIEREVHNLKGDSRLVGFHDVSVLCHKMEDLLRFGRAWSYRVPETIDLLVAAVIGFIRLLLQKRVGQPMAGLDLAEFSRQVDEALREAYLQPAPISERPTHWNSLIMWL